MKNQSAKSLAIVLALVLGVAFVQSASAQESCSATSTNAVDYDNGFNPRVALAGTNAVEVHNAGLGVGALWYHVGQLKKPFSSIKWGGSHQYESSGENPAVAVSGKTVVEVHNSVDGVGPLEYVVGTVNPSNDTITWGATVQFDNGYNPTIAIVGTTVIEVHNAKTSVGPLWYSTGTVNVAAKTIAWRSPAQYDSGFNPSVTASGTGVLEVHNGGSGAAVPLWYHIGTRKGLKITWQSSSFEYVTTGSNPAVGYNGEAVLEVHNLDFGGVSPMLFDTATLSGGSLTWDETGSYDNGFNPAITLPTKNSVGIEVHNGTSGEGALWYRIFSVTCN
ncbi:MAG: hypothetical protein WBV55_24680 [Candidatus Sulfotelmatobacter sp.]